ncbi:hypothetical protein [Streptomyces rubellomurinus]|uniref:hypothetical protein n=1 Tax=Streptomyces rubellomurinus (strain ATCC 31215) TaxID=359131 RepID=UPI00142895EC|nr:hypothetical protein [Streptomyces rubellomurinus]
MNKVELQAAVDTTAEHGYTLPQLGRGRGGADGSHGGFRLWGGGEDSMPLCHPEPALKSKWIHLQQKQYKGIP